MGKFGFGWEMIQDLNPRLIYCSITGFGTTGPYRDRPAYDAVASALSGIYGLAVEPANPRLVGVTISDNATGMYAVNGILSALYERERTRQGRRIEVNMLESAIAFTPDAFAHYTQGNTTYGPQSRIAPRCVPESEEMTPVRGFEGDSPADFLDLVMELR